MTFGCALVVSSVERMRLIPFIWREYLGENAYRAWSANAVKLSHGLIQLNHMIDSTCIRGRKRLSILSLAVAIINNCDNWWSDAGCTQKFHELSYWQPLCETLHHARW